MKKSIFLIALLIITLSGFSQVIGINFAEAITVYDDSDIVNEKLMKIGDGRYIIPFAQTPVGLKHCTERMIDIMADNDLTYDNVVSKDIFLASYVDGLMDYSNLCTSARVGSSEVNVKWNKGGYRIALVIKEDLFAIIIVKQRL